MQGLKFIEYHQEEDRRFYQIRFNGYISDEMWIDDEMLKNPNFGYILALWLDEKLRNFDEYLGNKR